MKSKTVNNKYNFMPTNDNLEINFQYGLNNIDINDYIPNPTVLRNYQKSLNSQYIFRKGI